GRVRIGGSKNASLPIMAAAMLTREPVELSNVARVADTALMCEILSDLGVAVSRPACDRVTLTATDVAGVVSDDLGRRMRASIVLLGALMSRVGTARLPRPGGDQIGARRVEMHMRGLRAMGAEVAETPTEFVARAPDGLRGARVVLDMPTVTGTENIIMAAVLAAGRTEIFNAAREPHVQDLCRCLCAMGARISGAGTDEIVVEGVRRLRGAPHRVIADYLEAGTYALAAAAAGGDVVLEHAPAHDLPSVLLKLQDAGVDVDVSNREVRVRRDPAAALRPVDLHTWAHPGFPTDLQPQYVALMTQAAGTAIITEPLYDNRFQHVAELSRMGARIVVQGRDAVVRGPARLHGTDVMVPDIRSGAALVIAALCAQGTTEIGDAWHIERGYEDLPGKLRALGADVELRDLGAGTQPAPGVGDVAGEPAAARDP
ncbi:MAG TPA: UDP-N-acetylglucosamine 1-carboxyvinyltransferase, partial [Candidatus Dormibacteraeota bacterium]|nr:UDP-N-acetylglucosamine 1-carboxyvinyltransferase [Candidatus Dormibacteraeota bacterium]